MRKNRKNHINSVSAIDNSSATPTDISIADEFMMSNSAPQKKIPFSVIEAYKNIRTNLIAILAKDNYKLISISSPNASEGKSTTSINVAIALSQLNKKVLLVDTDAHRPSIHKKLNLNNEDGLMNAILGITEYKDCIIHHNSSLDILTSGPIPVNSTELFSDPRFDELLNSFKEEYDYILLDAPPVNLLSDALVIAQKCDGLVLIIRATQTTHESFRKALTSADVLNINIIGTILNGSEAGTKRYYKYYKSYGYGNSKYR